MLLPVRKPAAGARRRPSRKDVDGVVQTVSGNDSVGELIQSFVAVPESTWDRRRDV
jgi:hypothetical protein